MTQIRLLFLIAIFAFTFVSCRPGATEPAASTTDTTAAEPAAESEAIPDSSEAEVTYEPAYPADVSEEDLSEEDVSQQEESHSHDGEHSQGDGDHTHGEGDDHGGHEQHGDHEH